MNKTKFILLAASFVLAMALTFSCSDDKDDSGGKEEVFGCRPGAKNLCFEVPPIGMASLDGVEMEFKEVCERMNDDDEMGIDVGIFYENGCSNENVVVECDCQKVNLGECRLPILKFYFYAPHYTHYKDLTCEQIFGEHY